MMMYQSQFIEMFGNPMTNNKSWTIFEPIGKNAKIVLGTTPKSTEPRYWDGDIKWITPAEMSEESFYINDTERHLTEEGRNSANLTLLPYRSVLFSTRAPIGKVALAGNPMYCNQGFKNFICNDNLNPVYLFYTLKFNRDYLISLGTGTTFKELSKKTVEGLMVAVPDLSLQNKFEEIYVQSDKSKFDGFKSQFSARKKFSMHQTKRHTKITRAICRQADDSRTDGKKGYQLPFPVMRFDVNFPATDHSKVASDADSFTGLFLTDYCKALSNAFNDKMNSHNKMIDCYLRALGGLHSSTPSVFFQKNRASISLENKYPVVIKHRELASSQPLKFISSAQIYNLFFDLPANLRKKYEGYDIL